MKKISPLLLGLAFATIALVPVPRPAQADTTSTAIIVAAAAIVGVLLVDANNQPYYVNNNRRYYVSQNTAQYYRRHYHTVQRQAWVPENQYPVQENAGYRVEQQREVAHYPNGQYNGQYNGNPNNGH